jgi:hypothetical protein
MGFWSKVKRGGAFIATGGVSELARLPGAKEMLLGGGATKGISEKPPNYDAATAQLGQIAGAAGGRMAPQIVGPAGGPQDQARQGQMDLTGRLGAIATGQQAGAGELAINRQVGQANAAQMSAARSARGANAALAARTAARNQADIGLGGAGQAAAAQMQDQAAANAQLGQTYGQVRQGDLEFAGLGQQAQIENMRAQLAQTGMNDAQQIAALGQQLGWDQARINAELQRAAIAAGDKGLLPGLIQAGAQAGAAAAASDERLKEDIEDGGAEADELMSSLRPRSYRYKDGAKWGEGRRLGIMAQDLARSKMGRAAIVKVDEEHMGFDLGKAASAALASVARLDERLRKVEGR